MKKPPSDNNSKVTRLDERRKAFRDSEKADHLSGLFDHLEASHQRPTQFLAAWKAGIELIGAAYFEVQSATVEVASDKNQLRPDFEVIRTALGAMSGGQQRFLIGMCQFYSDRGAVELCCDTGVDMPTLADLALLDDNHRSVIIRLLESYTGW